MEETNIVKSRTHKYIRRIPKKSGKGYNYFYAKDFKTPFGSLLSFFGLGKGRIEKEYEKNNIFRDFKVTKEIFAKHVLHYFLNKEKWDNVFSGKNKAKQVVKEKERQQRKKEKGKDEEKKAHNKKGNASAALSRALMRRVYEIYNKGKRREADVHEEETHNRSEAMKGNQNAKKDSGLSQKEEKSRAKGVKVQTDKEMKEEQQRSKKAREKAGMAQPELFERTSMIEDETWNPNSEKYRYKDTGYIAGSRKENAAKYLIMAGKRKRMVREKEIDWEGLEENSRMAEKLIVKSNIFGEVDWERLKKEGMSGSAAFLIDRVYSALGTKPKGDDCKARRNYVIAIGGIRERLEACKSVEDVLNSLSGIKEEYAGEINSVVEKSEEYREYKQLYEKSRRLYLEHTKLSQQAEISRNVLKREVLDKYFEEAVRAKKVRWNARRSVYSLPEEYKSKYKAEIDGLPKTSEEAQFEKFTEEHKNEYDKSYTVGSRFYSAGYNKIKLIELSDKIEKIRASAAQSVKLSNPLYNAWAQLGNKFSSIVERRSKSFALHRADARRGKYDDWKWLDKEVSVSTKGKNRKVNFELLVAGRYTRKGGRNVKAESTQELKERFRFRDVQSGNWVLKDPESAKWHVDNIASSFADLCDVTGIGDDLASLNGRLAMAIGARGKGKAVAHYEPVERVINITKMKGGGSLAHEWFHAFDNLISETMSGGDINVFFSNPYRDYTAKQKKLVDEIFDLKQENDAFSKHLLERKLKEAKENNIVLPEGEEEEHVAKVRLAFNNLVSEMMSGDDAVRSNVEYKARDYELAKINFDKSKAYGGLRGEVLAADNLDQAVAAVHKRRLSKKDKNSWIRIICAHYDGKPQGGTVEVANGKKASRYYIESTKIDRQGSALYWSTPHEMAARAFSAYIDDKLREGNRHNDYLAYGTTNDFYKEFGPYPEGAEREKINKAFEKLFKVVCESKAIRKSIEFLERREELERRSG